MQELLVIANAAINIADLAQERHLRDWRFVRTRPGERVRRALNYFPLLRLRPQIKDFLAKVVAGRVLERPAVRPNELWIDMRNQLTVTDIRAEDVEVAVLEAPSPLLNVSSALALSAFTAEVALVTMALASAAVPLAPCPRAGSERDSVAKTRPIVSRNIFSSQEYLGS
jgi:hypothetical protein